jgi:hypothetical protein
MVQRHGRSVDPGSASSRDGPWIENAELLATRIPGARLQVFEGGHLFMIQDRSALPTIIEILRGES